MRSSLVPMCLVVALVGCQTAPSPSGNANEHRTVLHAGDTVVSVIGTPFYLVFKGLACGASALVAAPVTGLAALSDSRFAPAIQDDLADGLARNCGPPYVLSPYRVVAAEPTLDVPPGPAPPPEPPSNIPEAPAPPQSIEPTAGPPETPTPPQPLAPPADHPATPTPKEPAKPAAEGPIEIFNE